MPTWAGVLRCPALSAAMAAQHASMYPPKCCKDRLPLPQSRHTDSPTSSARGPAQVRDPASRARGPASCSNKRAARHQECVARHQARAALMELTCFVQRAVGHEIKRGNFKNKLTRQRLLTISVEVCSFISVLSCSKVWGGDKRWKRVKGERSCVSGFVRTYIHVLNYWLCICTCFIRIVVCIFAFVYKYRVVSIRMCSIRMCNMYKIRTPLHI